MISGLNKGVKFGSKNSLTDWGIYLKGRPKISPPTPKTRYVKIAGMDGDLDVSEQLTGYMQYEMRELEMEFTILKPREFWTETYSDIMDYMHGKSMQIIMDEAPDYYYEGRVTVGDWDSENKKSTLTISALVKPYKIAVQSTLSDWLWNPFNFESGVIRSNYRNISVSEDANTTLQVTASRMPTSPKYVVTLTDSTPTFSWSQGGINNVDGSEYASGSDYYTNRIKTQIIDGLCRISINSTALEYAVILYDDDDTYLGFMTAARNASKSTITWLTSQTFTVATRKFRVVARRINGEDILPSAGSVITARPCMTVKASNNNTTYSLIAGTNTQTGIKIRESAVTLTFRGNGTVSVDYRQGRF